MDGNKRLSGSATSTIPAEITRENSSKEHQYVGLTARLVLLLITLLRFTPPYILLRLLSLIGASLPHLLTRDARIAEAQIARFLPELIREPGNLSRTGSLKKSDGAKKIVQQAFANAAVSLGETLLAARHLNRMKFNECIAGSNIPWERQKAGNGAIALSAHFGPWEVLAAYHARNYPGAFKVVGKTPNYAPFLVLLDDLRRGNGVDTIWRSDKSAAIEILRSLKKNEIIGFLVDQDTT
ncbi:MAG: hypothetical protein PHC51_10615, partial [bacterium]|nr:hypothetical protein [bacterium]